MEKQHQGGGSVVQVEAPGWRSLVIVRMGEEVGRSGC